MQPGGSRRRFVAFAMAVGMVVLVPTAHTQAPATECTGAPPDSTWLAAGPVYRDCEVDTPAKVRGGAPTIRATQFINVRDAKPCLRISLDLVVGPDGKVETDKVVVVESDHPIMTQETLKTIGGLRFDPARLGGQAVRQQVRYTRGVALSGMRFAVGRSGSAPPTQPPVRSC